MVNAFECYLVARRRFPSEPDRRVDQVLAALAIDLVPVTAAHLELAREAHARFGKGTGHPAGLNMGDCFAYALARERGAPLLYKGGDFAQTDLAVLS